jgi:hypothetical protein
MRHEQFTPAMLKAAKVPHYDEINGTDIDALKVRIKLFDRDSEWSWFICGADPETGTCFGWEKRGPLGGKIAYFQLKDLNNMQGQHGISIRTSDSWNPQTSLADVIEERIS